MYSCSDKNRDKIQATVWGIQQSKIGSWKKFFRALDEICNEAYCAGFDVMNGVPDVAPLVEADKEFYNGGNSK